MHFIAACRDLFAMAFLNRYRALESEPYRDFCSVLKLKHNLIMKQKVLNHIHGEPQYRIWREFFDDAAAWHRSI
jgi:hypothetical protein